MFHHPPRWRSASAITCAAGLITALTFGATASAAAPLNDDVGGAVPLGLATTYSQDTTEATTSAEEAALNDFCGAPMLEQGVWFTATPSESGVVGLDVTQSDYSAGMLVAQGSPGALEPLLCGPGVVAGYVEAGQTYYILVFGDGLTEATSGNLVISTFVPPPPPTVDVTVDDRASVDRNGVARLTGTVTCTSDDINALLYEVSGELHQKVGRFTINGYFYSELYVPCDGQTLTWSGDVSGDNGVFAGGKAATAVFAFGCGSFDCGIGYTETTVSLRRNGR